MVTPLACSSSSSLDMVQNQECSAKTTTSTNAMPAYDAFPHTTETRYFTKETMDQPAVPEIPSIAFLPEWILSSWLQSECNLTQSPIIIRPIHHTLENATITYDTLVEHQKELVKDVFFSPAMPATTKSTIASSLSSTSSSDSLGTSATNATATATATTATTAIANSASATHATVTAASFSPSSPYVSTPASCSDDEATTLCGSQTDGESTQSLDDDFNPSDLLLEQDDTFLFFGALDFDLENQQQHEQEQKQQQTQKKSTVIPTIPTAPSSCVEPTPALLRQSSALKRKRSDTSASAKKKGHSWLTVLSPKSTPPMSPNEHQWNYFDASDEDSSTDDDDNNTNANFTSLDYRTMKTDFQYISVHDDDFSDSDDDSISSWENRRANMFDDTADTDVNKKKQEDTGKAKGKRTLLSKHASATNKSTNKKTNAASSINANNNTNSITAKKQRQQSKKVKVTPSMTLSPLSSGCASTENHDHLEKIAPRPTCHPTLYQKLTKKNVDWCRYCGTTEGVNWRPGPWGKRTLCNKHGCDYKGYGFACKLPRLNLTDYVHESLHDRDRPVLQFYCATCHRMESWATNVLVRCEGCYKSYHQKCYHGQEQPLTDAFVAGDQPWYCEDTCRDNVACGRVVVEISRKRLPLMCAPSKNQVQQASLCNASSNTNQHSRYTSTASDRATRHSAAQESK